MNLIGLTVLGSHLISSDVSQIILLPVVDSNNSRPQLDLGLRHPFIFCFSTSLQPPSGSRQPPNFLSGAAPLLVVVDVDTASGSNLVTLQTRHILHISPSFGATSPSSSLIPLTD